MQKISKNQKALLGVLHIILAKGVDRGARTEAEGTGLVRAGESWREAHWGAGEVRCADASVPAASHRPGTWESNAFAFGAEAPMSLRVGAPPWAERGGQRALPRAVPQLPSAQSDRYAKVAFLGVAYSDPRLRHHLYLKDNEISFS